MTGLAYEKSFTSQDTIASYPQNVKSFLTIKKGRESMRGERGVPCIIRVWYASGRTETKTVHSMAEATKQVERLRRMSSVLRVEWEKDEAAAKRFH